MKPLADVGLEELRRLEEDCRKRCSVCKAGAPSGHHHHFCLDCGCSLSAEHDLNAVGNDLCVATNGSHHLGGGRIQHRLTPSLNKRP